MKYADVYYHVNGGLRLYARDYVGPQEDSRAILCLPGLTRNSKDFVALAEYLCKWYRVVCPDQRGRGKSDRDADSARYRPDVYASDMWILADLLQLQRFSIIGTSLGGLMAMLMTAQTPARIDRIVINDVGPEIDPKGIARIVGYVGRSAPVETWKEAAQQSAEINGIAFPDYSDADWMAMARNIYIQEGSAPILDYDPAISRALNSGSATPNLWPLFGVMSQKPVLAIRGALSDLLSEGTFAEMARQVPTLRPVVIPERGHAPTLAEPDARAAIDEFFAMAPQ